MPEMAGVGDDAILEGITKLGASLETVQKSLDARVSGAEAKLASEVDAMKARQEADADFIAKKIESLERRTSAESRFATDSVDDVLKSIPVAKRGIIPRFKQNACRTPYNPNDPMTSEIVQAASALWFQTAAKLQLRNFNRQHDELREELKGYEAALNGISKVALAEATNASGGFLVPTIVASEILRIALDSSVVYNRCRRVPQTSKTMNIPSESTGVTVNFVAEAGTMTGGEPVFGQVISTLKKIVGRATASMELVDDSTVDLMPYIQTIMGEKIGRTVDGEALEGSGTNFTGVANATGVLTSGNVTGAAPTYANLVTIMYKAGEESTRQGAAWFMNPQIFGNVLAMVDSNGQPVIQFGNVQNAPYPTILGRPVYLTNVLAVNVTAGGVGNTGSIYFGDPTTLIVGESGGMRFDVTDQVNWATGQFDMRLILRLGFAVGLPAAWSVGVGFKKVGT